MLVEHATSSQQLLSPAIVNAVLDALAPQGVTHLDMLLPAPKVWAALQDGGGRERGR